MKSISSKKGQVISLAPSIIVLIIAAFFLVMGVIMLSNIRSTDIVSDAHSTTTRNETLTTVSNGTGEQVAGAANRGFNDFVVLIATNATGGEVIPSSNYTTTANGFVNSTSDSAYLNKNWNVSYTYNYGDEAYAGSNSSLVGLATFADFWEIIVLAIVLSAVIAVLLITFGRGRSR